MSDTVGMGSEEGIDLDFTGIQARQPGQPVPNGVYLQRVEQASVEPSKDGKGKNIVLRTSVQDCADKDFIGHEGRDLLYIPNPASQTPEKFKTSMEFFKGKLEAIFGNVLPDNYRLNVKELVGLQYLALVVKVDQGRGPFNETRAMFPATYDHTKIDVPAGTIQRTPQNGTQPGTTSEETGQSGRFRI